MKNWIASILGHVGFNFTSEKKISEHPLVEMYQELANDGKSYAYFQLGIRWLAEDRSKSKHNFLLAAQMGDVKAHYYLAKHFYLHNVSGPPNASAAYRSAKIAADGGYSAAYELLGDICSAQTVKARGLAEAARWYDLASECGSYLASYTLGSMYAVGKGISKNLSLAEEYYHRAISQAEIEAQRTESYKALAVVLIEKINTYELSPEETTNSLDWIQGAAEHGSTLAKVYIAQRHLLQRDIPEFWVAPVKEYMALADQKHPGAMLVCGLMYCLGIKVSPSHAKAIHYLVAEARCSASEVAQWALGNIYLGRLGQTVDIFEAEKWLLMAATQGHAGSQEQLGSLYADEEAPCKNLIQAYKWFGLAAAQGSAEAKLKMKNISVVLTEDQLAEAKTLIGKK